MKERLVVLVGLLLPVVAAAQDFPKITEQGKMAALELVRACEKAGALKLVKNPRTQQSQIVVADEKKLKEVVRQRRDLCTPLARDVHVRFGRQPGVARLLVIVGQETGDRQATAYGLFFTAKRLTAQLKYREARHVGESAIKLFEQLRMAPWQASALLDLAYICREQEELPLARKLVEQALTLCRQSYGERHSTVAAALTNLALVCKDQGDLPQARKLAEKALGLSRELHRERHPAVAACLNNLASICQAQGDLPQARRLAEQTLALYKQLHGERHPLVATALGNLAGICQAQGELPQACRLAEQALALSVQINGKRHPDVAISLNNLASIWRAGGDLPRARKLAEQALSMSRELYGEYHSLVAAALSNLALVCKDQGDLPQARKLAERALGVKKRLHGERHSVIVIALNNLAAVALAQGDLSQAHKFAEQALALSRQIHGECHPLVATSLGNLAAICQDQGDLPRAHRLSEQALALFSRLFGKRHPDVANALSNLASYCLVQGDFSRARRLAEEALALRRQLYGEQHPDVALSLNNLASICKDQGDLPRARKFHEQALALKKRLYGERHPLVAISLNNLALVCKDQGDLPQARKLAEEALALHKQLHGERHPLVATALSNLALICRSGANLPRARRLAEEALALRRQLYGEQHPDVALSLNNLASICQDQGDRPQARKLHEQALVLKKRLYGERHPAVATSLNNLATVCVAEGNLSQGVQHLTDAVLACRLPHVGRNKLGALCAENFLCTADTIARLNDLGWLLHASNKDNDLAMLRRAAHCYALAAGLLDRLRSDGLKGEGKLNQGARWATLVPARVGLAAAVFQRTGQAQDLHVGFEALEQGRGRVFLEALGRARAYQVGGVPDKLRAEELGLHSGLRGLDAAINKDNARVLDQRNADLVKQLYEQRAKRERELDAFAARLRKDYPQYAALQYPKPCTLAEARECLADNEVAVLFALDRKASHAVIVQKKPVPGDKGEGVAVVKLSGSDALGPLVATLTDEEMLKSDSRCRRLGAELYALLFKPLEPHLKGKDLVLAPDGILWTLPFELLVEGRSSEDDGKYLAQTRKVRYTPSITVLHLIRLWEKVRQAPPESLWALGDPVFSKDDPRAKGDIHRQTRDLLARYALRSGGGPDWQRLPATGDEVRDIAKLHQAARDDVVTDVLASEAILKGASAKGVLARKRYIHLATHGWLGSGLGKAPSLVLSLVGNDGKEELGGVNEGYLSMMEVTHLKLNADLVVLSACQTGKGQLIPAEGVVGLTRSFLYAGSRGVVCSLWCVDDEGAAALMKAMYTELKKGKSSGEALALARRQLIAQERPPFYWAPFILIGK